jgi:ribosomal protein S18 acetylase RimI-like enzyme
MKIRRYQQNDWARICEIHDLARMDELRGAGLTDAFLPLEIAAEREELFDYDVLVADKDGLILGFVAYSQDELTWLYVDPAYYRTGIGGLLVRSALAERPAGLCIKVLQGNEAALDFYKSIGFVESKIVNGWMPGNEAYPVTVHCLAYASNA